MDLAALRALIDKDPVLAGYAAEGRDTEIWEALRVDHPTEKRAKSVTPGDLIKVIGPKNMPAVTTPEYAYLQMLFNVKGSMTPDLTQLETAVPGVDWTPILRPAMAYEVALGDGEFSISDVSACYHDDRKAVYDAAQAPLTAVKEQLDVAIAAWIVDQADPAKEAAFRAALAAVDATREQLDTAAAAAVAAKLVP